MKHLSDPQVLEKTRSLAKEERRITLELLEYLAEVEARRLYISPRCTSLFEFCVTELGYAAPSAQRRIDAMWLLRKVPQAAIQVASGELNLTQLSQVQVFLKTERKDAKKTYSEAQTTEILSAIQGQSTRATEKILLEKSPALQARRATTESQRLISPTLTELKIVADEELVELMQQARARLGNSNPSMAEVMKIALQAFLKASGKPRGRVPETDQNPVPLKVLDSNDRDPVVESRGAGLGQAPSLPAPEVDRNSHDRSEISPLQVPKSRYIPIALQRALLERAGYLCEFKGCENGYALQFHHLDPYAYGGAHTFENLIVLCRGHHRAVEANVSKLQSQSR